MSASRRSRPKFGAAANRGAVPRSGLGASQREPGLQKPDQGKYATIAASFGQRPSHGLSTLVTISNRFEQPIDGHYNTARRAGSTVEPGSHWISTRRNPLAWIARAPVLAI